MSDDNNNVSRPARVLIYDIEISPIPMEAWGTYETNALEIVREQYLLSFAWKWLGEDTVHVLSLPDFLKTYRLDPNDDTELVKALHGLFNDADIVVANNGDAFDRKKANGRFLKAGLPPPRPYTTIDTLKLARHNFSLPSNRLAGLGEYLGLGGKTETEGFWRHSPMATRRDPIGYDPFAAAVRNDPYPWYRRMRDEAPAYYMEPYDAWALSCFEDVWNASADAESYSAARGTTPAQLLTRDQPVAPMINLMDPPEHTSLRALVSQAFTPRMVRRLEPRLEAIAHELVEDALAARTSTSSTPSRTRCR